MGQAKIEVEIGKIRFSGEGEQKWLSEQLKQILDSAESLMSLSARAPDSETGNGNGGSIGNNNDNSAIASQSLASYLKSKNATTAQVDKFLATSAWVSAKSGKQNLKTSDVSSALTKASQSKINNPSDKLNQNVAKGYCEKHGSNEFFITQEGHDHLGK